MKLKMIQLRGAVITVISYFNLGVTDPAEQDFWLHLDIWEEPGNLPAVSVSQPEARTWFM